MCQLRKAKQITAKRRRSAERLCQLLSEINGVRPPKVVKGANPSWWRFTFSIDTDKLVVTFEEFGKAIRAEGMPFCFGYIPHGVFEYRALRDRITFGASGYPWSLPDARKDIVYRREDFPNTMRSLTTHFGMSWIEGITVSDAQDIGRAVRKVAEWYRARRS